MVIVVSAGPDTFSFISIDISTLSALGVDTLKIKLTRKINRLSGTNRSYRFPLKLSILGYGGLRI